MGRRRGRRRGQARLDHQPPHALAVAQSQPARLQAVAIAQGILPAPNLILGGERQAWLKLDAVSYIHLDSGRGEFERTLDLRRGSEGASVRACAIADGSVEQPAG